MDLSFPLSEHLPPSTYSSLLEVARSFNLCHFAQALSLLEAIIPDNEADLLTNAILKHWHVKLAYEKGEYIQAYNISQEIVKMLKDEAT